MTDHQVNCFICGESLQYFVSAKDMICSYCGREMTANASCIGGHFVCDSCHSLSAFDLIERYCVSSAELDPVVQAMHLMSNPAVKMHGPEHHFLVPAVIISAFLNRQGAPERKHDAMHQARIRASDVKGGFCGLHGTCGAAMGAGIACSVITGATPLSREEWRHANLITATCLTAIANAGGPRCCKRDVFFALRESVAFLNTHLSAGMPVSEKPICKFHHLNQECLAAECDFFPLAKGT